MYRCDYPDHIHDDVIIPPSASCVKTFNYTISIPNYDIPVGNIKFDINIMLNKEKQADVHDHEIGENGEKESE